MLIVAVIVAIAIVVCVLAAMWTKVRFKASATLAKWFSFNVEVGPQGKDDKSN
jgi:hypothetical protein